MKTRLPISTISFNTEGYLRLKLEDLRRAHIISDWFYISHKGEDDEAGKRDHFHVHMTPSKGIQTDDVRDALIEYDPQHPDKPRKCLSMKISRFGNWYLYAIHDPAYLASKGESRKYHYAYENIVTSDEDILNEKYHEIDIIGELGAFKGMEQAIKQGLTFSEYFRQGKVPPQQVKAFEYSWQIMTSGATFRGDHSAHPVQTEDGNVVDPDTGECIEE